MNGMMDESRIRRHQNSTKGSALLYFRYKFDIYNYLCYVVNIRSFLPSPLSPVNRRDASEQTDETESFGLNRAPWCGVGVVFFIGRRQKRRKEEERANL